jgi:hypothetical protein
MKRTFKYALAAVIAATAVSPAFAQDGGQFPDVPANHWAYKDLADLKAAGLLVGYPDGLYRGGRPASRYELAVAIHAVWTYLKNQQDALKSQIDDILKRLDGKADKSDLDALKAQVEALAADLKKVNPDDIAKLMKLTDEFRTELTALGVDVKQLKSDVKALTGRVDDIEKRLPKFDISGDLNLVALGGYSSSGRYGVDVTGRPTGYGKGSYAGTNVGATRDLSVGHEGAITIKSHDTDEKGVKFKATAVYGNLLGGTESGALFGSQSKVPSGAPYTEADSSLYFQNFEVSFDSSLAGLAFNAKVGRLGYQISPYIFKRPDTTPYFSNERWDNGDWAFDGGQLGFNFGKIALTAFGGRVSSVKDSNGNQFQFMDAGKLGHSFTPGNTQPIGFDNNLFQVDQILGLNLGIPLASVGKLNVAYLWLDSNQVLNTGTSLAPVLHNGTSVYGGDFKGKFGPVAIGASYSKSDIRYNSHSTVTKDNAAYDVSAGFDVSKVGVSVGYRRIEPQFSAPGDWGRIGIWWNPTDIKGVNASAKFNVNDKLKLTAKGEFLTGTGTNLSDGNGLSTDDKINHYNVDLDYKLGANGNVQLGYELVDWNLASRTGFNGGKPQERWYNIGFGYKLNELTKFSILWQISDYDGKGINGFNLGYNPSNTSDSKATGGLITTQITVKF